jgi:hypothetical protein
MATPESQANCNTLPEVDCDLKTTVAMDADVKLLANFKDKVDFTLVKDVFEPVIAILTIVKVGFSAGFPLSRSLISVTTRMGR